LNASKLIKAANWIQTSGNAGHLEGITDTATPTPQRAAPGLNPSGSAPVVHHHPGSADQTMLQTVPMQLRLAAQRSADALPMFWAGLHPLSFFGSHNSGGCF
jgi:hypothetical protein